MLTVSKLNPKRPKRFTFRHQAKKLVGCLIARGDETEPYTVKLQSWGTITGRLVDAEGKPRPGAELMTSDWQAAVIDPARGVIPDGQKTDADGRFRYEGLVPGQEYSANAVGEKAAKRGFRRRDRSRRAQARRDPRPGRCSVPPRQTRDQSVSRLSQILPAGTSPRSATEEKGGSAPGGPHVLRNSAWKNARAWLSPSFSSGEIKQ